MMPIEQLAKRLIREPLLHFLALGGLLFASQPYWQNLLWPDTITVSHHDIQLLEARWLRDSGRAFSEETRRALLRQHIDEEILLREAQRLGLHERDPVVRERLIRNMQFIEQDAQQDEATLLQAAMSLGMTNSDLVVRRRLLQLMRHRIESQTSITAAEARAYFEQQPAAFAKAPRYDLQQIYFAQASKERVQAAFEHIASGIQPAALEQLGDPFLMGHNLRNQSQADIARQLGSDVAQAISQATPKQWFGPISSAYGQHLLYVERIHAATTPSYAEARRKVAASLYAEREAAALRSSLDALRSHYRIRIEPKVRPAS